MDNLQRVIEIMQRLRDPETGCPWDLKQDFASIVPHTLEEAYEVADAIERGDLDALRDELGDLLFQVIFYCQLATEMDRFGLDEVAVGLGEKLVRRHPHVFGGEQYQGDEALARRWEAIKRTERERAASRLDGIPRALPALRRAQKLQGRAARSGFDWPEPAPVRAQVDRELAELDAVDPTDVKRLEEELGDVLFSCVNLARHIGVDAEAALRRANRRFTARFSAMEAAASDAGTTLEALDADTLEALWQDAKRRLAAGDEPQPGPD